MKVVTAAMILGILGGVFGLLIGLFGYGLGAVFGATGSESAWLFQMISIAIPIAAIIGGSIVKTQKPFASGLMVLSAMGMFFVFGMNIFTILPLALTATGGILGFLSATQQVDEVSAGRRNPSGVA